MQQREALVRRKSLYIVCCGVVVFLSSLRKDNEGDSARGSNGTPANRDKATATFVSRHNPGNTNLDGRGEIWATVIVAVANEDRATQRPKKEKRNMSGQRKKQLAGELTHSTTIPIRFFQFSPSHLCSALAGRPAR